MVFMAELDLVKLFFCQLHNKSNPDLSSNQTYLFILDTDTMVDFVQNKLAIIF